MPNLNKFIGCGHLASRPEKRVTNTGKTVTNFTVGISYSFKKGDAWEKSVEWVKGIVFGKQAEWLGEADKGDLCVFEGELRTRKWEDKNGETKYTTEVICSSAEALKKNKTPLNDGTINQSYEPHPAQTGGFSDDSIPFARFMDGILC